MSFFLIALIAAVVAQGLGMLWFTPIFGRQWMTAHNMKMPTDPEAKKAAQKSMMWQMIVNFVVNYMTAAVLFLFLGIFGAFSFGSALPIAGVLFLGFVLPYTIGGALWHGFSGKNQALMSAISIGYQIVLFLVWIGLFAWLA